ncbi:MAG: sulfonate/nitrate transport system substrate-binding protein [Hyphomicrobiales bacterium]|jgi:ABC-type nitrate/sulfonate/bicarbonate transport system substrate-binding protein|nr:sulfonate/nitrate transport system substrate-binding protein [Hyphomicrobiales bacterium]
MRCLKSFAIALALMGSTALGAARAEEYSIKVATPETPTSFDNLYLQIAYEKGFFKKNGLIVTEFMQLKGGPLATTAVVSGQADVTATDVEGVIQATKAGYGVRAVSSPSPKLTYVVAARKEITSWKDLKGKPFAVSRAGALSQYVNFPFLARDGLTKNDVQWLSVGSSKDRLLALSANRVKAAVLYIDDVIELRDSPDIHFLGEIAELLPNYAHELLLVNKDDIDKRPEKVTRIVQSIMEACRFLVTNREESIEVFVKYTNANPKVAGEIYDYLLPRKVWGVNGGMTEKLLDGAVDLSMQNGAIDARIPHANFADFRFQEEALKRLGGPIPE